MADDALHPVVNAISELKSESNNARVDRIDRNRRNRDTLHGRTDYSAKLTGQSQQRLPKLSAAMLALSAVVSRGLTGGGDWFSIRAPDRSPISDYNIREILKCFIENLHNPGGTKHLTSVIADAVKAACTDSLMIVKVLGAHTTKREFFAERGESYYDNYGQVQPGDIQISQRDRYSWRLSADLVPDTDYYPDPTGAGMFEIHSVRREVHDLLSNPLYDQSMVNKLISEMASSPNSSDTLTQNREDDTEQGKNMSHRRKQIIVDEFWGTITDAQGNVTHENVVAAVANGRYLIRPPEPNPLWHGESPFVVAPLVRVPHSLWHRAIYDDPAELNDALNELYNLIFDGGLASVWGVRQVRRDMLSNPDSISAGIPPHKTLEVKAELPAGAKVVETVAQGNIPPDAFQLFNVLDREFQQAALVNDVRLGNLPPRRVKATEIIESQQSQSVTIDSLLKDCENDFIEPLLRKSWLTCLQFADLIPFDRYEGSVDAQTAIVFHGMPPVDRFIYYGQECSMSVYGLSQSLNRLQNFQKLVTVIQVVSSSPILLQAFVQQYSPNKILASLLEALDIRPSLYELTLEERTNLPSFIAGLPIFAQLSGQPGGGSATQAASQSLNNPSINLPQ